MKYHSGCDEGMVRHGMGSALDTPYFVQSIRRPGAFEMEFESSRDGLYEHLERIESRFLVRVLVQGCIKDAFSTVNKQSLARPRAKQYSHRRTILGASID